MSESEDILLAKWLAGELTEEQQVELASKYDLQELASILKKQEQFTPETKSFDEMWKGLKQKQGDKPNVDINTDKLPKNNSSRILFIVAGFLLLASIITLFLLNRTNENFIETKEEKQTELAFADGSFAVIGPQSKISYNKDEWEIKREVNLNGQAFFTVSKGQPFTVSSPSGKVEVLGTEFDVWSIHKDYMRVACSEGRVRITDNKGNSREITANEHIYINNGQISEILNMSNKTNEWRQNFRNYQTTPVRILLKDLERFYNIRFTAEPSIKNDLFSGILPTNDLAKCVRFLETSLSYESEQKENNIIFTKTQ